MDRKLIDDMNGGAGRGFRGWMVAAALAVAGLALLAGACGGGGEDTRPTATESPEPSPEATATPGPASPASQGCDEGNGPPQEGSGGPDLEGRIVFARLVFGCSPEVYIMNADGSDATNLTNDPSLDDEPDLSPDGSKVVFFSGREGNAYLYIMNADGSDLQRLTEGQGGDVSPRWSPDGSRIAFSRNGSLAVMNADGSDLKIIMEAQPSDVAEPCRAGSFVGGWSPDGKRITYYSAIVGAGPSDGNPGRPGRYEVCAIDADGSNLEALVSEPEGNLHAEPHWSPDGKKIVFRDDRDGDCSVSASACNYEVYVLDLETGQETNVTSHPAFDIEPTWSPDGEWIVFASNRDDPNFDLYVVRPDGSDVRRLLDDPAAKDSYPSWVR